MRTAILAMATLIGVGACNREAEKAKESASEAIAKVEEEARKAGDKLKEGADKGADKTKDAARDAGHDIKEGADKTAKGAKDVAEGTGHAVEEGADKTAKGAKDVAEGTGHAVEEGADKTAKGAEDAAKGTGHAVGKGTAKTAMVAKALLGEDYGKTESDKQLTKRIRSAIKNDKSIPESEKDMAIRTENGEVKLTGTLSSGEAKRDIARIAEDIAGKSKVKDEIKVADRVGTGPND